MIITSFSQKGYHQYGKRFIQSFLANWKDERLTVFYEKSLPRNCPVDERLRYINLYDYDDFIDFGRLMAASDELFKGLQQGEKNAKVYNYRLDANRFYRKVFAMHCYYNSVYRDDVNAGKTDPLVAWIDADVYVHDTVPDDYLRSLMPEDKFVAYLNRPSVYTETGFLLFDFAKDDAECFMDQYWEMYSTGAFQFLGEWHDCYVFDFLRTLTDVAAHKLCEKESNHPFINSPLGRYMDHMKGPERKQAGRSDPREVKKDLHDARHWDETG